MSQKNKLQSKRDIFGADTPKVYREKISDHLDRKWRESANYPEWMDRNEFHLHFKDNLDECRKLISKYISINNKMSLFFDIFMANKENQIIRAQLVSDFKNNLDEKELKDVQFLVMLFNGEIKDDYDYE